MLVRSYWVLFFVLLGITILLGLYAVTLGAVSISFAQIKEIVHGLINTPEQIRDQNVLAHIMLDLRLPRVMLAFFVGAGLAVAGAVLQASTRNPLADPYLFGLSAGAALGVVALMVFGNDLANEYSIPVAAFAGGMAALGIVITLAFPRQGEAPERLILAGVAVAFLCSAISNFLIYLGGRDVAQSALFWMLGGMGGARWHVLPVPIATIVLGCVWCFVNGRTLDAMTLGEENTTTLGIDVRRTRLQLLVVATLMTSVLVAVAGAIGFVGLVIPHLGRQLAGGMHFRLLPVCAMMGGLFLVAADALARSLTPPTDLPVGIVTAGVGGVYFLLALNRRR